MTTILMLALLSSARAQTAAIEEKARFERAAEEKLDAALSRVLGPGRSKAAVDATLNLTNVEKVRAEASESAPKKEFWWDGSEEQGPQILPGIAVPSALVEGRQAAPRSYERRLSFPSRPAERLAVTLIVDESLGEGLAARARSVAEALLGLDEKRGDALRVVRAPFASPWSAAWRSPESGRVLVQAAAAAPIALGSLGMVALGLSRIGRKEAAAQLQASVIDARAVTREPPEPEAPRPLEAVEAPKALRFEVEPEQVELLAQLLRPEHPANVAVVVSHLEPGIQSALLSALPREVGARTLVELGRVRYVEPAALAAMKEKVETRLRGTLGGMRHALEVLGRADAATQKAILEELKAADPDLAREVRRRTLLTEDLLRLADAEWRLLYGAAGSAEWAAICAHDPELARKIESIVPERTWALIKELAEDRPSPARAAEARARVLLEARRLVSEGRIADPLRSLPELMQAGAGVAPRTAQPHS